MLNFQILLKDYIGTGCKKETNADYYENCFLDFINKNKINPLSIKGISTIALKKDEKCINNLCQKYNYTLEIIDKNEIEKYSDIFEKSDFVKEVTGTSSVSEGSAYIASGKGKILCKKTKYSGITFAIAKIGRASCRERVSAPV